MTLSAIWSLPRAAATAVQVSSSSSAFASFGQEAVLDALPVLADWPEQDLTCFDLMYLESEAITRTMLRLKRERGA